MKWVTLSQEADDYEIRMKERVYFDFLVVGTS